MWSSIFRKFHLDAENLSRSAYRGVLPSMRENIQEMEVYKPKSLPRMLILDDDEVFARVLKQCALKKGASSSICLSIDEISNLQDWNYDVVVMDFDLGAVNGFELAQYLELTSNAEVPVILVSQSQVFTDCEWPKNIREFVHKDLGSYAILDAAFEAHEINLIHKSMQSARLKAVA